MSLNYPPRSVFHTSTNVSTIMIPVVAHAMTLNERVLTCSSMSSFLLISKSMKMSTNGSTPPLTTCDNNKPSHDIGKYAPYDHVQLRSFILPLGASLLHHRRLQVELHPGGDRRSHHPDHKVKIRMLLEGRPPWRSAGCRHRLQPGR